MAEPAKKSTFRKDFQDPIIDVMKKAGEVPEYQQMMDYLMVRRAVPTFETRYLGDSLAGLFQRHRDLPPAGRIMLNGNQDASTLIHEVTHAAERQITNQYHEEKYPRDAEGRRSWATGKNQFTDAYEKLSYHPDLNRDDPAKIPVQQLMNIINKPWTEKMSRYRTTGMEANAFAVENATNPKLSPISDARAPAHIDSTLATQMMILLDLATRAEKAKPQSQGR